ncbi:MAG: hypothetical protein JKY80_09450 [Mariprofundaceae bacterium]|nr:hypothetical protein [Mariprofundaceae bacterium]
MLAKTPKQSGRPVSDKKTSRLNVTFPEALVDKLQELQDATYAGTLAEVFRNALVVYSAIWEAHKKGAEVVIREKDGSEKTLALFL